MRTSCCETRVPNGSFLVAARRFGWLGALGLGTALAAAVAEAADTWPRFRGPEGDGGAAAVTVPLHWDRTQNIAWRTEIPGQGWSSPVVAEGIVYLSAALPRDPENPESDYDLALILVDADSGRILRVANLLEQMAAESPEIHAKNSHASPTPIVAGERIYVHFGHQGTACTDREGNLVWATQELSYSPVHGNGGSPVLVDDRLIFTCDGASDPFVAALDARDGSVLWRTERPVDASRKFSFATPTVIEVDGATQVIAPGSDCVISLDPADGEILWWVQFDGYSVIPKPVMVEGLVLVTTGFGPTKLMAIRPDGRGDVTETHVPWEVRRGIPKTPSLAVHQGRVFLVSDDGIGLCVDGRSGEEIWRNRLGGNYSASPVRVGDRLYFTSEEGLTTVIRAGDEFEKLAANDLGERTLASMAVADGALFQRTEAALYRIEER